MSATIKTALDHTYKQLLKSEVFYGHGTDNAWDEAVFLVLSACGLPLTAGEEVLVRVLTPAESERLHTWLKKRIEERLPLPYITEEAWFCGLPFYVNAKVLIPRSPFAEWVQAGFQPWCHPENIHRVLEIGTGSGCIAIATALALPHVQVDATDISPEALQVAEKNIVTHDVAARVHLFLSDVYEAIPRATYDLIVSNPPYVSSVEMQELPVEYTHEPALGLEADNEGMAVVDRILSGALQYLSPTGILMVEVGYSQDIFSDHYPNLPVTWLDQSEGGEGIFLITAHELQEYYRSR